MVIDAHAHIIQRIHGRRGKESTSAGRFGKVKVGQKQVQMLPSCLADSTFPPEMLIALMDAHDVDRAVLLQNPVYGIMNGDIGKAVELFPDRFIGTIQVDPFDKEAQSVIKEYHSPEQSVLKFEMSKGWGWTGIYDEVNLTNYQFLGFWELASELGLSIIIDPGPVDNPGYQVEEIDQISDQFPDIKILIEHLGYMTLDQYKHESGRERWQNMINLARKDNVFIGFSAIYALMEEDYPCPLSLELLQQVVSYIGSEKVLWGTDIPTTLRNYTYQQMTDLIFLHADFLTASDKDRIMGKNARNFFNWEI